MSQSHENRKRIFESHNLTIQIYFKITCFRDKMYDHDNVHVHDNICINMLLCDVGHEECIVETFLNTIQIVLDRENRQKNPNVFKS